MNSSAALRGLYAITDHCLTGRAELSTQVAAAVQGGARMIQYRDKGKDRARRIRQAGALLEICRRAQVPLIINDDLELAAIIGADGIHLGRDDVPLRLARQRLGPSAIIGVSCYDQLARAREAQAQGADYVAFGRFFPSRSKPRASKAEVGLLPRARAAIRIPLVAIGGITPENGGQLLRLGADMLAVIHGVFGQPDIVAAARRLSTLFEPEDPPS